MTTAALRKRLITYIADAEDKKVKGLYLLMEQEIEQLENFQLSAAQVKLLAKEKILHEKGKTKSYSWAETKESV